MIEFFLDAYRNKPILDIVLESIAFFFGIISVWYAKKENVLVYPTGLVATVITVYLLYTVGYYGDMVINFYYLVMSIYGWYLWSRASAGSEPLAISRTTSRQKFIGIAMFFLTIFVIYGVYIGFGYEIKTENYIDMLTSGIFFTAMYYMALKKIESWTLWIIADIICIPLYAYRGLGMLSLQFIIFTILAVQAYVAWKRILNSSR
ncbi:MAG TPA: nicotinamide riboside transporter PnuC [Flavobacterium sp.]|jgi:nicotinamide mononucleotide transporter|nr:nicotinamide riboside transporter PnuC [Flavobacterium sp.]